MPNTRQANPKRRKGDDGDDDGMAVPTRAKNNVASIAGLVGYALRKVAVSLRLQKQSDWYRQWGACKGAIWCVLALVALFILCVSIASRTLKGKLVFNIERVMKDCNMKA